MTSSKARRTCSTLLLAASGPREMRMNLSAAPISVTATASALATPWFWRLRASPAITSAARSGCEASLMARPPPRSDWAWRGAMPGQRHWRGEPLRGPKAPEKAASNALGGMGGLNAYRWKGVRIALEGGLEGGVAYRWKAKM